MSPPPSLALATALLLALGPAPACRGPSEGGVPVGSTSREDWGLVDEQPVGLSLLTNARGTTLRVCDLGATIVGLELRDRQGNFADVVLGFDALSGYLGPHPYFGGIVGRCANRIAGGRFELDGTVHVLARNDGSNHLHGGPRGFDRRPWTLQALEVGRNGPAVRLSLTSPDGEEGYPATVEAEVTYTLRDDDVLMIDMRATSDAPTLVNLASHAYWNLAGHDAGPVGGHLLRLHASRYLPVDAGLIPTGDKAPVEGTPFDLRRPTLLGPLLQALSTPGGPGGFDHDFVVDGPPGTLRPVATVSEPASGRTLELWSDQPGVQLYTANGLDGSLAGKGGARYARHGAFCLETQKHPDAIHHPGRVTPVLRPGEEYRHRMELRFGVER